MFHLIILLSLIAMAISFNSIRVRMHDIRKNRLRMLSDHASLFDGTSFSATPSGLSVDVSKVVCPKGNGIGKKIYSIDGASVLPPGEASDEWYVNHAMLQGSTCIF